MNKAELVEGGTETGLTKKVSREAVDTIISATTDFLARAEKATLVALRLFNSGEKRG